MAAGRVPSGWRKRALKSSQTTRPPSAKRRTMAFVLSHVNSEQ